MRLFSCLCFLISSYVFSPFVCFARSLWQDSWIRHGLCRFWSALHWGCLSGMTGVGVHMDWGSQDWGNLGKTDGARVGMSHERSALEMPWQDSLSWCGLEAWGALGHTWQAGLYIWTIHWPTLSRWRENVKNGSLVPLILERLLVVPCSSGKH